MYAHLVIVAGSVGCFSEHTTASSAGSFVTDIAIDNERLAEGLVVSHCSIDSHVTEVSGVGVLIVSDGERWSAKSDKSHSVTTSDCGADFVALPAGILPQDDPDVIPSWCAASLGRWRQALHQDRFAELERRRIACKQTRIAISHQATAASHIKERERFYQSMPDCDALRLPLDAPATAPQVDAWAKVSAGCRPYAKLELREGSP